jgi:hypothetical protein
MTVVSQPSPPSAAQHRARAQEAAGDLAGARMTLELALDGGRATLGEDHPAVLAVAHQLATVLQRAGDFSAARRVLEEAFAAGQWRLGDADPLMLAISFDLGLVAEELGNRHEARKAFGRVAAHGPQALGDDHWAVTRARAYLGEDPPTVRLTLDRPVIEMLRDNGAAPAPVTPQAAAEPVPAPAPQPARGPQHGPEPRPESGHVTARRSAPGPAPEQPVQAPGPEQPVQAPGPVAPNPQQLAPVQRFGPETGQRYPDPPYRAPDGSRHGGETAWQDRQVRGGGRPGDDGRSAYPGRGRGPAVFAAIAAGLAAVIAVVALVIVLSARNPDGGGTGDVPTLGGQPPTDVQLRDAGSTIEVSWRDPTDGTVSFVVMVGRTGEQLKAMGRLGPAQTELELHGLNARLDYCVAVVAVYAANKVATSPQTCTSRTGSTPTPTTSD